MRLEGQSSNRHGPSAAAQIARTFAMSNVAREQVTTVMNENNHNLTRQQKELMLWHNRLAHAGQQWIQDLMLKVKHEVGGTEEPVIPTKQPGASRCPHFKCPACQLGRQHRRTPDSQTTHQIPEKEMAIRRERLTPGDKVSMDQCVCKQQGRLEHTYGKEDESIKYNGGTIFVDHASQFVWIQHQVSLRVGETLTGKHAFEKFANEYGVTIKNYRSDNHPFGAEEFRHDLHLQGQGMSFSGVGAHHGNGVAERTIRTITTWARAMMMHLLLHWPEVFHVNLWPFAMNYAKYIWIHMPRVRNGLSPLELFTRIKKHDNTALLRARVWGCPVYVLDPKLQDGKKLPKWNKRARKGIYLGVSEEHSSTVGLIGNLETGAVSPQYHVMYDELFTSVHGTITDM